MEGHPLFWKYFHTLIAAAVAASPLVALTCPEWLWLQVPRGAGTPALSARIEAYAKQRAALGDSMMRAAEASGAKLNILSATRYFAALDWVDQKSRHAADADAFVFRCMMALGHDEATRRALMGNDEAITSCLADFGAPQGLVHDDGAQDLPLAAAQELVELFRLPFEDLDRVVTPLATWTRTPAHAAYLHYLLSSGRIRGGAPLLQKIAAETPAFGKAYWLRDFPGVPVTFSFEKETLSGDLGLFYRSRTLEPPQWLAQAKAERARMLTHESRIYGAIASMPGAPRALGPVHLDAGSVLEAVHRQYDVDPDAFFPVLRTVAHTLHETEGFHVHVVSELPRQYRYQRELSYWWVHANHYLLFRGIEEGLLPSIRVGISGMDEADALDTDQSAVFKMFSLGLRGGPKFGVPLATNAVRLSMELRDVTRDIDLLERDGRWLAEVAVQRLWEKRPPAVTLPSLKLPKGPLSMEDQYLQDALASRATDESRKLLNLGFAPYENARYFDYRTGQVVAPSAAARRRIVLARQQLRKDLRDLLQDIHRHHAREFVPMDIAFRAVQWTIAEWGKRARISELYSGVRASQR